MNDSNAAPTSALKLIVYWLVAALPLAWGVWLTILKLPALFR